MIAVSAIRQRVAAAIGAAQATWRASLYPLDVARWTDSRPVGHLAYGVEVGATAPTAGDRVRRSSGAWAQTELTATVAYRLRAESLVADLDSLHDTGADLVRAVLTAAQTDVSIEWAGTDRPVVAPDGSIAAVTARFRANHRYDLN